MNQRYKEHVSEYEKTVFKPDMDSLSSKMTNAETFISEHEAAKAELYEEIEGVEGEIEMANQ